MGRGQATPLKTFYFLFKIENDNVCELKGGRPVNGIASELPMQRIGTFIVFFWQWKWMSVVIRLKVPIEMHYTVIPMGTSKVNSFLKLILRKFKKIKKDKKYKKNKI